MQWARDPNLSNIDNINNVRRKASRNCRNKKKEYLKAKIDELDSRGETKNNINLYVVKHNLITEVYLMNVMENNYMFRPVLATSTRAHAYS